MDKNQGSDNNYNKHLQDKSAMQQLLQQQVIQNAHANIQRGAPILRANDYNYKVRDASEREHPQTWIGRMHQKCVPFLNWCKHFYRRYEESARTRRRWVFGTTLCIIFGSLAVGMLWTKGIIVANTPAYQPKTFINGDSVYITREKYDPHTQSALIFFTTKSDEGDISANDLDANFRFANQPKTYKSLTPTIQLLPMYQNHFVIFLRNIYSGYHGISIRLTNHEHVNLQNLSDSLQAGDDGLPSNSTSFNSTHMGAYHISDNASQELQTPSSQLNASDVNTQLKLLHKVQHHNYQYLILSDSYLKQHEGYVNPNLSAKDILNKTFKDSIHHSTEDIELRQKLIANEKSTIKQSRKHIRSLYKQSDMSSNDPQIKSINVSINEMQNKIQTFSKEMYDDQQAVNEAKDHWNELNNGTYTLPEQKQQNLAESWGSGNRGK